MGFPQWILAPSDETQHTYGMHRLSIQRGEGSGDTTTVTGPNRLGSASTFQSIPAVISTSQAENTANGRVRFGPVYRRNQASPQVLGNRDVFVPMDHLNEYRQNQGTREQPRPNGMSNNYAGNVYLPSNQSANIPERHSTSLWLTNLPPDCTHWRLLGAIRNCGKIYAAVINPPELPSPRHPFHRPHTTSAAKLVFFDREGVDRLWAKSQAGQFSVDGYVPLLRMNRIRSKPQDPTKRCRVLHISGPSEIVNETSLNSFFLGKFTYELEAVTTLSVCCGITRQEWRFGSFRCQAESALLAITREKHNPWLTNKDHAAWNQVHVHYGVDPCDRV
ncbi:hypothetical protein F5Y04DRAFT_288982 [Hypomontagnella monticulosa]|nr:hypothetical protein F5Y04DRAFT_288982 [Hypomontagnella monticulosa]